MLPSGPCPRPRCRRRRGGRRRRGPWPATSSAYASSLLLLLGSGTMAARPAEARAVPGTAGTSGSRGALRGADDVEQRHEADGAGGPERPHERLLGLGQRHVERGEQPQAGGRDGAEHAAAVARAALPLHERLLLEAVEQ